MLDFLIDAFWLIVLGPFMLFLSYLIIRIGLVLLWETAKFISGVLIAAIPAASVFGILVGITYIVL